MTDRLHTRPSKSEHYFVRLACPIKGMSLLYLICPGVTLCSWWDVKNKTKKHALTLNGGGIKHNQTLDPLWPCSFWRRLLSLGFNDPLWPCSFWRSHSPGDFCPWVLTSSHLGFIVQSPVYWCPVNWVLLSSHRILTSNLLGFNIQSTAYAVNRMQVRCMAQWVSIIWMQENI